MRQRSLKYYLKAIYLPKRKHYQFGKYPFSLFLCGMKSYKLNGTIYYCPVDLTLSVVGGRWQGLIIWALRERSKRFSELKRELVAVNDKMLSQTLKLLVEQGVVTRLDHQSVPPKVEYSLTENGQQLLAIFEKMEVWGEGYSMG